MLYKLIIDKYNIMLIYTGWVTWNNFSIIHLMGNYLIQKLYGKAIFSVYWGILKFSITGWFICDLHAWK